MKAMIDDKHPSEMSDEILYSLGFVKKPYDGGEEYWTHKRADGKFYFHVLTPNQVADALIEIGHSEFRKQAVEVLSGLGMDGDE